MIQPQDKNMSYFLMRIGEGSKYVEEARKGGFIAVGWNELPDLFSLNSFDKIKKELSKHYEYTANELGAAAGSINRFVHELKPKDFVLSPLGQGKYAVAEVGEYYYEPNPKDGCPYKHRRKVKWQNIELSKSDMSSNLTYSLGATLAIFSLNKYSDEITALLKGEKMSPAEKTERIRDIVLAGLLELDGRQFEEFIQHLLTIIGFEAQTTQYVGDRGIDVNGILNAQGIAEITLRVQVKRARSTIGNKDILAMRGTLAQGEHACFVTLSDFSKKAIEEAEAPGKIPVKLIDGEDLATLILKNFEDIDEKYKVFFPIKRKKDFNIEALFEPQGAELVIAETPKKEVSFDTLICSAWEDGFNTAFLGQKAWWAVRIREENIPFIKYLAIYQVAPVSAITYYGEVDKIEPFEDSGKYKLFLKSTEKLQKAVGLGKNPHLKPQGPRYTTLKTILKSKTLDELFSKA